MKFRMLGLDAAPFRPLFGLPDEELATRGVLRVVVEAPNVAPDRIELRDAEVGESVLLLNHQYLDVATPYRGSHAIYVREGATRQYDKVNEVPQAVRSRLMSLRGFDQEGMMVDADVIEGVRIEDLIERLFAEPRVAFIQAHHARRGCYAARIERVAS
jgi:hypothetical protein